MVRRLRVVWCMKRLACSFVTLFAACGTDARTEPTDEELDDIAMSVASTVRPQGGGGELGAMIDVGVIARGGMPAGFAPDPTGLVTGQHLGLAYRYQLECRDAHNRVLPQCGSGTENADVSVTWAGLLDLPYLVMVIERDGAWILNDITPELLRLDGEGHMTYESRVADANGVTSTYHLDYDASHRAIMIAPNDRWPRSGSVRYDIVATRTRTTDTTETREFVVTAELRFSASGLATISLDDTHAYELSLATGAVTRAD